MLPVSEPEAVVVGTAAEVEHDTQDNEPRDGQDFDGRKDEFGFAVGAWVGSEFMTGTLTDEDGNNVRAPNKLITTTTTRKIVIHAALFTSLFLCSDSDTL